MTDTARLAWLRLARSEGIGPVTFARLIETYGQPERALAAVPDLAKRGGRRTPLKLASADDAARELEAAGKIGARLLIWTDPDFPPLLRAVDPAPPLIYTLGDPALLARRAVAIVGARNASAGGRKLAEDIAAGLGAAGLLVVSGLARGIDTAAHIGAVATGTAAVLAGGVDNIYPPENARLHARIAAEGVVVSEMPPGTTPQTQHFPRRNRIISGLALGAVVVEAAIGSGSLITARYALEQNREVFAVPGSPIDARARGCNDLIRQGATLTESAEDVLSALQVQRRFALREDVAQPIAPPAETDIDAARPTVLELLGPTPVPLDDIIRRAGLPVPTVLAILLELELGGRLHRSAGQTVALL
ncbi:MAG: DNA-processing protein DprA [Micropepsaceae bacterium]